LAYGDADRTATPLELRAFVVKIAPAFQAHLQMAENLDKQLAAR
jgi:hypothetical protein